MIAVIGDSITYGQHLDPKLAWPNLIDADIRPFGVPGDTTRLGLERFPVIQNLEPSTIIIQFGHNDANRWDTDRGLHRVSPRAFRANLEEMVERARTFRARPAICTITPSRRSTIHEADCERYDDLLRRVAIDEDVLMIDTRLAFLREGKRIVKMLMPDGLHLSKMGHALYASTVQKTIDAESLS